jgi:hypothetical protein
MRVYHEVRHKRHTLIVCPGNEFPNVSDWKDAQGKPLTLTVKFIAGEARVPSNLGQYLLDKGLAQSSPIIVPKAPSIEPLRRGPKLIEAAA